MVYKGKKPVHWCIHCRTALAEAEVEYETTRSPSIYVEFPLGEAGRRRAGRARARAARAARCRRSSGRPRRGRSRRTSPSRSTRTPVYGAYPFDGRVVIVAEALAERLSHELGRPFANPVAKVPGTGLRADLRFRHPLYARDSLGVLADYVTLDTGTGVVHTAPGHGATTSTRGVRYGLEIYAPVGGRRPVPRRGRALRAASTVFEANPKVEAALAAGRPALEVGAVRALLPALLALPQPGDLPGDLAVVHRHGRHGPARRRHRGDQARASGSPPGAATGCAACSRRAPTGASRGSGRGACPIPAVTCTSCGDGDADAGTGRARGGRLRAGTAPRRGTSGRSSEFLPAGLRPARPAAARRSIASRTSSTCGSTRARATRPCSRSTPNCAGRPTSTSRATTSTAAGSRARCWSASARAARARIDQVVTHGMVVTEEGKKMSKSLGNDVPPEQVITKSGAEILRLWVASVDFREEVRFGPEILARVVEAYRKLRNTLRILAANLSDFNPADRHGAAARDGRGRSLRDGAVRRARAGRSSRGLRAVRLPSDLPGAERLRHRRPERVLRGRVEGPRLHARGPMPAARRSAQTAMFAIADGLARLIAPVLPVLAEEFWAHLPGTREESVHLAEFPKRCDLFWNEELVARWSRLLKLRAAVNAELEKLRQSKAIGQSLEAVVHLRGTGPIADLIAQHRDQLPGLFITSQVDDRTDAAGAGREPGRRLRLRTRATAARSTSWRRRPTGRSATAAGATCRRCRRAPGREGVCPRCEDALAAAAMSRRQHGRRGARRRTPRGRRAAARAGVSSARPGRSRGLGHRRRSTR